MPLKDHSEADLAQVSSTYTLLTSAWLALQSVPLLFTPSVLLPLLNTAEASARATSELRPPKIGLLLKPTLSTNLSSPTKRLRSTSPAPSPCPNSLSPVCPSCSRASSLSRRSHRRQPAPPSLQKLRTPIFSPSPSSPRFTTSRPLSTRIRHTPRVGRRRLRLGCWVVECWRRLGLGVRCLPAIKGILVVGQGRIKELVGGHSETRRGG